MPKGPKLTENVKLTIARVYREHPKWKGREIRNEVNILLREKDPKIPEDWPGVDAVQRVLALIRKKEREVPDGPQESPWNMAALDAYPEYRIPLEGLRAVLDVWKFRTEREEVLSIREAKWAARLSVVVEGVEKLSACASDYASLELMYELIDRPFDSTLTDKGLMGLKITPQELIAKAVAEPTSSDEADIIYKKKHLLSKRSKKSRQNREEEK